MKSIFLGLTLVCLALICIGCSQSSAPPTAEAVETTPPPPPGVTLVKLKLPGMVCGGCAMEVKDTLAKVDGVSHLAADPAKHECTFWFTKADSEIKAKLDDLAERVDRLVLRHHELKRTSSLIEQQLQAVTAERDSLRSRLGAARARVEALLERLPPGDLAVDPVPRTESQP